MGFSVEHLISEAGTTRLDLPGLEAGDRRRGQLGKAETGHARKPGDRRGAEAQRPGRELVTAVRYRASCASRWAKGQLSRPERTPRIVRACPPPASWAPAS